MASELLAVGSIPLDTADDTAPASPDASGVESWRPLGMRDQFQLRVKPGVTQVRFGDPGWRLGYTKEAVSSHFAFRASYAVIPVGLRLQVCPPPTYSAIGVFFPDPANQPKSCRGSPGVPRRGPENGRTDPAGGIGDPIGTLLWRTTSSITALAHKGSAAAEALAARLAAPAAEIAPSIPQAVALGYHGCFGTRSGWPSRQPTDLSGAVIVLNAMVAASGRRVDFLHLPTLGSAPDSFFALLARLTAPVAKVYPGAIHHMDDSNGFRRQLQTARRYLADFGLAAPCGFGRAPERLGRLLTAEDNQSHDIIDIILSVLLGAVELLHETQA